MWVIRLRACDPTVFSPVTWPGINLLGCALMKVRRLLHQHKSIPFASAPPPSRASARTAPSVDGIFEIEPSCVAFSTCLSAPSSTFTTPLDHSPALLKIDFLLNISPIFTATPLHTSPNTAPASSVTTVPSQPGLSFTAAALRDPALRVLIFSTQVHHSNSSTQMRRME